jgi:hypothetical protein
MLLYCEQCLPRLVPSTRRERTDDVRRRNRLAMADPAGIPALTRIDRRDLARTADGQHEQRSGEVSSAHRLGSDDQVSIEIQFSHDSRCPAWMRVGYEDGISLFAQPAQQLLGLLGEDRRRVSLVEEQRGDEVRGGLELLPQAIELGVARGDRHGDSTGLGESLALAGAGVPEVAGSAHHDPPIV